jgi:hypothetical protein
MADHLDNPGLTSPAMDARVDITDIYAFQKPGTPGKSILILNVNPLAPAHADEFRHDALYELLVDNDGDARPDLSFRFRFTRKQDGKQFARVKRAEIDGELEDGHVHEEFEQETLIEKAPVSFGTQALITEGEDATRFFAGFRSDPFFFDLLGFLNGLIFTGSDFFLDKNVFGIVLEVPNRLLGSNPNTGLWARTLIPMTLQPDHLTQVDQMGRPAINTVFNHGQNKVLFNQTPPHKQRNTETLPDPGQPPGTFLQSFTAELQALSAKSPQGPYTHDQAEALAKVLLPDILTFNYSSAAGFLNGRQLQDDVIDIALNLVTRGAVPTDKVGPHTDYLSEFPYLGKPHP